MPAGAEKTKPASLKRPGDKGTIKKTSSGKFQPQLFINELNKQRALGSYETAEEAAAVLATANDKIKNKEPVFVVPVKEQAKHGTVCCTCPHSALHIHSRALTALNALTVSLHVAGVDERGPRHDVGSEARPAEFAGHLGTNQRRRQESRD